MKIKYGCCLFLLLFLLILVIIRLFGFDELPNGEVIATLLETYLYLQDNQLRIRLQLQILKSCHQMDLTYNSISAIYLIVFTCGGILSTRR